MSNVNVELESTLMQMTVANNQVISTAEKKLKIVMREASCVSMFLDQIQNSSKPAARQLSAILLRKRIAVYWDNHTHEQKNHIKNILLSKLISEPEKSVQRAIAGVVANTAKKCVPNGEWNELLEFLFKCFQDPNKSFRELSMLLFRVLSESVGDYLMDHFDSLMQIFSAGMTDAESLLVREESVRAIGCLFNCVESDQQYMVFQGIVPHILQVIQCSIEYANMNAVIYGFDVLSELSESPVPILEPHIPVLVMFCCSIVSNSEVEMNVRERANGLIAWLLKYQSVKVLRLENGALPKAILQASYTLLTEEYDDDDEGDVSSKSVLKTQSLALEILDELLINLPNDVVYTPSVQMAVTLIGSSNPLHRSSGQLVLFVMAEGCGQSMLKDTNQLLDLVCTGIKDPHPYVRANASAALTQFSEHLQPEILKYHNIVLGNIFTILDNPSETVEVKERLLSTLDAFVSELDKSILTLYLEEILGRLINLLMNVKDRKVLVSVLIATSGVATTARESFPATYASKFMDFLLPLLNCKAEEDIELRSAANRAIGSISLCVGKVFTSQYFNDVINASIDGMNTLDYPEIRESTYAMYAYLAEALEDDFNSIIPHVVERIFVSMDSNDGVMFSRKGGDENEDFGNFGTQFNETEESNQEQEDEDDYQGRVEAQIITGFVDEKLSAMQTLSAFFKYCPRAMTLYLKHSLDSLELLTEYLHDSVRTLAVLLYDDVFKFAALAWPMNTPWVKGEFIPLNSELLAVIQTTFPVLITTIGLEFEKSVASMAADVLVRAIKQFGSSCLGDGHLESILQTCVMILEQKTPSQHYAAEDATAEDDNLDELLESCGDLLAALAKVLGSGFSEYFVKVCPSLLAAMKPDSPFGTMATVLGAIGDITAELGEGSYVLGDSLFPILIHYCQHQHPMVRRSAAYAIGSMFVSCNAPFAKYYTQCICALEQLFHIPEGVQDDHLNACKDNACSAIGKMILGNTNGDNGFDLGRAIGIFMSGIPLVNDIVEAPYVYRCLLALLSSYREQLMQQFSGVIALGLIQGATTQYVEPDLKQQLNLAGKQLFKSYPQSGQLSQHLSQEQRAVFATWCN